MSALPSERPPTLLDVARAAGVSKATVTKVASGNGFVIGSTRRRIERSAAAIGYRWRRRELREVDMRAAVEIFSMSKDDHRQYVLEGVIALSSCEVSDEDHDPTPVPTGCPGCWCRNPGAGAQGVCLTCPDRPSKQELRAAAGSERGPLTPLERKVAERAAAGFSYQEIADQIDIAPKTARSYRSRACVKLGVELDGLADALAALDD